MIIILTIFAFIFGAVMASFFGVLIYRLPKKESIVTPPSHCPSCEHLIKWYDNIPVISYLVLRGKCRYCKSKIGLFSFIYELLGGVSLALTVYCYGVNYLTIFILIIVLILYFIAGYDYKTYEILDVSWISLAIVSLGLFFFRIFYLKEDYLTYLIATAIGFTFFFLIKVFGKAIMKQDCLGGGDVILMGIAGLFLGVFNLLIAILVASFTGSVIEIILLKTKKKPEHSLIAFGPYLVLGIIFALLFGDKLMSLLMGVI